MFCIPSGQLVVFVTIRNKVVKVMFLQAWVCPQGECVSQHALQEVSQHALQQVSGGCIPACIAGSIPACIAGGIPACLAAGLQGVCIPACPYPGTHPRGKLRRIRSRPTPNGKIEGDQVQAHTQGEMEGDQVQAHTQEGNGGGSDPGPHPRGKLRGVRSIPPRGRHPPGADTPQSRHPSRSRHPPQEMATAADSMHPTGMPHSCWLLQFHMWTVETYVVVQMDTTGNHLKVAEGT